MYFKNCNTLDEAKTLFRKLAHELHPDKGGDQKSFIKMYAEFKAFRPTVKSKTDEGFNAQAFSDIVHAFRDLVDVNIEFVGSWIWISDLVPGATKEQRFKIKEIKLEGFEKAFFHRKRLLWMIKPIDEEGKKKVYSKKSDAEIKSKYGCKTVSSNGGRFQLN